MSAELPEKQLHAPKRLKFDEGKPHDSAQATVFADAAMSPSQEGPSAFSQQEPG